MGLGDDGFAVLNLLTSHMHARDNGDRELMASLWAEDGALELIGLPRSERIEGRDNIIDFFFAPVHGGPATAGWFAGAHAGKHVLLNPVVRLDGDEATAVSDFAILGVFGAPDAGGAQIRLVGRYLDRLRRTDGGWALHERKLVAQLPGVSDEFAAAAAAALADGAERIRPVAV